MASNDRIGVVTVTYNSAGVLPDFLRCMAAQSHRDFLLFAVDNASKDDTLRLLGEWNDERLRVIANPDNRGVAGGNNQGILAALEAGCASILLLNNDTTFDPGLIAGLDAGLSAHAADMTCPKIMFYDEPNRIWAAGGTFQPWLGYRSTHFGEGKTDRGQYDRARRITYVPTCCVLIRREVFDKVGLMDERYFVYVDDVDFMYRAMKADTKLIYLPGVKLMHKVGGLTGGEESPFTIRFCTRNRVYFMLRHLGIACSLPFILLYQAYYGIGLLTRRFSPAVLLIKQRATAEGFEMWRRSLRDEAV
jgi:GT2 family glycosyltransferase